MIFYFLLPVIVAKPTMTKGNIQMRSRIFLLFIFKAKLLLFQFVQMDVDKQFLLPFFLLNTSQLNRTVTSLITRGEVKYVNFFAFFLSSFFLSVIYVHWTRIRRSVVVGSPKTEEQFFYCSPSSSSSTHQHKLVFGLKSVFVEGLNPFWQKGHS